MTPQMSIVSNLGNTLPIQQFPLAAPRDNNSSLDQGQIPMQLYSVSPK